MDENPIPDGHVLMSENIRRQPDACAWCGTELEDSGKGRPRKYCSRSCRQREYELRTARQRYAADLDAGTARDHEAPVSRTVTRTRYVTPSTPPDAGAGAEGPPLRARAVQEHLERVAAAIRSGELRAHDHKRVWRGLTAVLRALDEHHPGGLDNLR